MAVLEDLEDEEAYLFSLLDDESGLDLAEFSWKDDNNDDGCWRAWPFQWNWFRTTDRLQIDHSSRSMGKSVSIQLRGFIFPFVHPGMEMLITAPELIHLQPVTSAIETRILSIRLAREMLDKRNRGTGFTHQPFGVQFSNGSRIMGRIPQRDGKGVKGTHPLWLEMDESSDYPEPGWIELNETLRYGQEGAVWRCIAEGQLVLTRTGWKSIETIEVGDQVLTHKSRWRRVLKVFDNGERDCVLIKGQGHPGIIATVNHKFYTRPSKRQKYGSKVLGKPTWTLLGSLPASHPYSHWASPARFPEGASIPEMVRKRKSRRALMVQEVEDRDWLWLYGLYLAEGYGVAYTNTDSKGRVHNIKRVHWCVNDSECDEVAGKLKKLGFSSYLYRQGRSVKVVVDSQQFYDWLVDNSGSLAHNKRLAPWVLGLAKGERQAIFDGMTYGDGFWSDDRARWEYATVSRRLALDIKLLGQSLGYVSNIRACPPKESRIGDRVIRSKESWIVQMTHSSNYIKPHSIFEDNLVWSPVSQDPVPVGIRHTYDIEVEEDHSYIIEGIVVSNSHGVTTGVRNRFYEYTQPESGWTVHRIVAMHRPDWSDEERQQKALLYGGRNSPDYKRNILGEHGDQANPLFVLARLMNCVDDVQGSDYNNNEYIRVDITHEKIKQHGLPVEEFVRVPANHSKYEHVWIGMDVGMTNHPTEILVFAEEPKMQRTGGQVGRPTPIAGESVMKLMSRWHLERISAPDQRRVLRRLYEVYKPHAISLDKTGVGLPIYQDMMEEDPTVAKVVKGYNFSAKVAVDWEDAENIQDSVIMKNVLEYASDKLREYVDAGWIKLPWDLELIKEWQGQSFTVVRTTTNPYGKREYSKGSFHSLDAGRMAILGKVLDPIEKILNSDELGFDGVMDKFYG